MVMLGISVHTMNLVSGLPMLVYICSVCNVVLRRNSELKTGIKVHDEKVEAVGHCMHCSYW